MWCVCAYHELQWRLILGIHSCQVAVGLLQLLMLEEWVPTPLRWKINFRKISRYYDGWKWSFWLSFESWWLMVIFFFFAPRQTPVGTHFFTFIFGCSDSEGPGKFQSINRCFLLIPFHLRMWTYQAFPSDQSPKRFCSIFCSSTVEKQVVMREYATSRLI